MGVGFCNQLLHCNWLERPASDFKILVPAHRDRRERGWWAGLTYFATELWRGFSAICEAIATPRPAAGETAIAVTSEAALVLVPICETLAGAVLTAGAASSGCPGLAGAAAKLGPDRPLARRVFQLAVLPRFRLNALDDGLEEIMTPTQHSKTAGTIKNTWRATARTLCK